MQILLSPPQAPRANAIGESREHSRHERLARILIHNEAHAPAVLAEYVRYYHQHRPHRSRRQLPPDSTKPPAPATVMTSRPTESGDNPPRRPDQPVPENRLTE
ncbi:integrase core domain-containing protein [Streptomyces sp. NPDC085927]|uniref:integrase core domain-containing protein n=1 Tax=Streptomyces sp. NPDC085927 TaxID=3365738 RepID=UPI0037CF3F4B